MSDPREFLKNSSREDPRCVNCEHPLWAPSSIECGLCSACVPEVLGISPNK